MQLKRLYTDGKVTGVEVQDAPFRQHFSPTIVEMGAAQGWLSMGQGRLTLHGANTEIVYKIERSPGYYCCHCQHAVDDGPSGVAHVAAEHAGIASPDGGNPGGYRKDNFFSCVKEE